MIFTDIIWHKNLNYKCLSKSLTSHLNGKLSNGIDASDNAYVDRLKKMWSDLPETMFGNTYIPDIGPHVIVLYYKHSSGEYGWAIILSYVSALSRPIYCNLENNVWNKSIYI